LFKRLFQKSLQKNKFMEILLFAATVAVSLVGFLLARELNRTSEELKHLRQDVFRLSVDLAKLQERLDGLI
jgi:hypothetical protein